MLHEALQIIHNNNQPRRTKQTSTSSISNKANKIRTSTQNVNRTTPQFKTLGFGSSVAIHKLRESKWFTHNECKILLSVVESGFVLERRTSPTSEERTWGIALWKSGQEKSKNIDHIRIYSLHIEKDKFKVMELELNEFWQPDDQIRINNQSDKDNAPNSEEDIRKQVAYALKNRSLKWHNNQHFAYWCRYEKPVPTRIQQISDRVKWSNIGVSVGMLMMRNKNRRPTTST